MPSNFLERALYLEAERLAFLPSALDQGKFDTEREVVKNERRQSYENRPYGLDAEAILAALFPKGHPYSWSVIGSMDDLNKATLDDLKEFFAEFYHPANATLCLAGDFDPAEAKALIAKYFGTLAAGPKPKAVAVPPATATAEKLVRFDRVQLPRVYWSWPAVAADHPDAPALDLLGRVLVRRRDVAAASRARAQEAPEHGRLRRQLRLGVGRPIFDREHRGDGRQVRRSARGDRVGVRRCRERDQGSPPKADEVARALALFEQQSYARLTSPLSRAVTLATGFAQKDDPRHYQKEFSRYYAVNPADLTRVARTYLTPEKVVVWTRAGQSRAPAERGDESRPEPVGNGRAARCGSDRAPAPGLDWSKMPAPSSARPFRAPAIRAEDALQRDRRLVRAVEDASRWYRSSWLVPSGTADDPIAKSGLARLTTVLLDKGTTSLTATELGEALEKLGVTLSTRSSSDETTIAWTTSRPQSRTLSQDRHRGAGVTSVRPQGL